MDYYLAKTEPGTYSIDDLKRDGTTVWDGVTNPQAVKTIRGMKRGDRVFIYHTGGISAIAGLARVADDARPDPKNPKSAVVDLEYTATFETAVTLAEIKASGLFADWALVRQGRLSTMAVPEAAVEWIRSQVPSAKI